MYKNTDECGVSFFSRIGKGKEKEKGKKVKSIFNC